jgi:glycosyltransferase involved in cell wall biosynthesis
MNRSLTTAPGVPARVSQPGPQRPTRVAVVVTKFVAGAGGVALRGALALDPQRYSVTVFAADGGPLWERAERAGLGTVRLRHMSDVLGFREDARGVRELAELLAAGDFDVVHTHSAKAGGIGRMAARRAGVPAIIHTFHGFPFHRFQSVLRRRSYIWLERRLGRNTDHFLAIGTEVAAEAVRLGIAPPDRIRVVASAIDRDVVPRSATARANARRLLGVPADAVVVGSVGRLDFQKSPQDLVTAMALLGRPDVFAVWIGDGPFRPKVERLIARTGLTDRFLLLGERSDVPELLAGLDVFAMSSLYEGIPCAVVEAMTCGIPVVASAVNAVPDVVIPGRTGLLSRPGDPEALSRAVGHLLDHPAQARRMAREARLHIGQRFDPAELGRDLDDVYRSVLADSPRARQVAGKVPA